MTDENKEFKVQFAPGCFDNFEGTQEELDAFIAEITRMFKTGEVQQLARPLDLDDLDEDDIEILEKLSHLEDLDKGRNLQ